MRKDAGILIAAGDKDRYLLIERTLFRTGITHETRWLSDGRAALDFLTQLKDSNAPSSKQPWLLILELNLPMVSGLEILKMIKTDSLLKVIPVIVLASSCGDDVLSQCREAGGNMILTEPAESDVLDETLTGIGHFLSVVEIPTLRIS